ncbi:MAG: CRISPR-associated helicase Cas3' [Bacteroidetes bacterium]|nr:CRISPR-associated helicase Cas3' [Bacteroidota bacterium]
MSGYTLLSHQDRLLADHLKGVWSLAETQLLGLSSFDRLPALFSEWLGEPVTQDQILCLFRTTLAGHDSAKATSYFQTFIKEPKKPLPFDKNLKSHALPSAILALRSYREEAKTHSDLFPFLFLCIRYHHRNLPNFEVMNRRSDGFDLLSTQFKAVNYVELKSIFREIGLTWSDKVQRPEWELNDENDLIDELVDWGFDRLNAKTSLLPYFLFSHVFGTLLHADKTDAILKDHIPESPQPLPVGMVGRYKAQSDFTDTPLNQIREAIFKEVEETCLQKTTDTLFSLNVPTGTGKTFTALHAAQTIRKTAGLKGKLIYCLPFTSVIDQNAEVFKSILQKEGLADGFPNLIVHHHRSEVKTQFNRPEAEEGESAEEWSDRDRFLMETWDGDLIVTTFWQFLNSLLTNENKQLIRFPVFSESVIILDEVQAVPHDYWLLIHDTLMEMTRFFNARLILVTATLPLIFDPEKEVKSLIADPGKWFRNPVFNRIHLDLTFFREKMTFEKFAYQFTAGYRADPHKKRLVIVNTIKTSLILFKLLKSKLEREPIQPEWIYLSTNITPKERLDRIQQVKQATGPVIVVSTQLVEAGVDIDMDEVYRDLAPFDSILQSAGRCNRNGIKKEAGTVFLLQLENDKGKSDSSLVYGPVLTDITRNLLTSEPDRIPEPDFFRLSGAYYKKVHQVISTDTSRLILDQMYKLNYESAFKNFELIKDTGNKQAIFIQLDEHAIEVWEKMKSISQIPDRWKRKQKRNELNGLFQSYCVSVSLKNLIANRPVLDEDLGYWIPAGQLETWYDPITGFKFINTEPVFV